MLNEENKAKVSESDTGAKELKKETKGKAKPAAKTETKSAEKKKAEPVMYLGPDIKGIANHGEILSDGCDSLFNDVKKKVPLIHSLCVPLDQAPEKYAELKAGGAISKLYQAAAKALRQSEKGDDSNEL